ncbi:hypothetical protein [Actinopolymorpha alba]|uniref:hypothetical protein n=1 Tax=Actinopolymorpha alba TaxID=533267 RepID=UPI00037B4628|nr:hypothetical protein [Actinopolymorpha alba]
MTAVPRIALISAAPAAMQPAQEAVIAELPQAEIWHLLDDRLLADAEAAGGVAASLQVRMNALIDIAIRGGADAVLLTCSQYGAVAQDRRESDTPIVGSDDGAFAEVVELAPRKLLIVASLESAALDTKTRLGHALADAGIQCTVDARIAASREMLGQVRGTYDTILLAQYSLAPLMSELDVPVISPPTAAAAAIRRRLSGEAS